MAFPSSVGRPYVLANAWESARQIAGQLKTSAQNLKTLSLAGPVTSSDLLNFQSRLVDSKASLATVSAVPGLAAYAQAQVNDNVLDVAASFSAMATQIDATGAWIVANFPKDGSGYLLASQFNGGGRVVDRTFATAALVGLRAQLDLLIATID